MPFLTLSPRRSPLTQAPLLVRTRLEAEAVDRKYRNTVHRFDRQGLGLEERIEDTRRVLQRWQTQHLQALKAVLLQFRGALSNLPRARGTSASRIATYLPDSDFSCPYRTLPNQTTPSSTIGPDVSKCRA
jgi:hypothetical protein